MDSQTSEVTLLAGPVDAIAGAVATSQTLLFVTRTGALQTLWRLPPTGVGAIELRTEATVVAREPFVNDNTGIPRTWIRGEATGIRATFIDDAGVLKGDVILPTGGPVIGLSGADNDSHGHATWSIDQGAGAAACAQADIYFPDGVAPVLGSGGATAADCFAPRIDSGPPGTDSIATVFRSSAGTVEMAYFGSTVGASKRLSERGRAPRIRFDGTWFWVAWIDESGSGEVLRVAKIAQDLTFDAVDLPGWTVAGDEAFELVKKLNGNVGLVLLGADTLSILHTCP
jgi:hypothetical protein